MPKYGGAPTRRRARRNIVVAALIATGLVAGVALASNALQPSQTEAETIADDTLSAVRQLGTPAPKPTEPPAAKHGWNAAARPTPTPAATPAPTASPTETPSDESSPEPTESDPVTEDPPESVEYGDFPTMDNTGPTVSIDSLRPSGSIKSEENGQVIEGLDVESRIKITHDDVTVRNVRLRFDSGSYGLHVAKKNDDTCPQNVVFENVEVSGTDDLDDESIAVYSPCPFTLRDSRIFDVGSAVRITNGTVIENNFILANHILPGSDSHRSAIGLNGGRDHVIVNNNIDCDGKGCSGALVMYGDFAPVENVLIEHNLFNSTGSYCTYAGSLDSKPHPVATDVRYIDNEFGRKYFPTCGRYGPVAGRDSDGGHDFVWENNTWADTGEPVGGP